MTDKTYTTIEQIDSGFRKTEISIEDNNSSFLVKSAKESENFEDFKKPKIKSDRVVIAMDSNNATTIESVIKIKRDSEKSEISKEELDKLVYKSLWEFLNKYRSWAYKKMGITDLDMVLANVSVVSVLLDDKKVFNPVNLKGENFNIKLRGTFAPRDILDVLEYFQEFGKQIRVVERFAVSSFFTGIDFGFVLNVGNRNSFAYKIDEDDSKYHKEYKIGTEDFIESISESLKIKRWEAREILRRYFNNDLSKKMNELTKEKTDPLFKKIKKIMKDLKGRKRKIDMKLNIPKELYNHMYKKDAKIELVSFKDILESHQFNVIINGETNRIFGQHSFLSLVNYPIFSDHYTKLNSLLQKRSKWLVPNK